MVAAPDSEIGFDKVLTCSLRPCTAHFVVSNPALWPPTGVLAGDGAIGQFPSGVKLSAKSPAGIVFSVSAL